MICLDTNYLIMALVSHSREAKCLLTWAEQGETFSVSSIVWYEFLCGPITDEQQAAIEHLIDEIIPFDDNLSKQAADLFNQVGRSRQLRVDAMIAATAMSRNVSLATHNISDFTRFTPFGLRLVGEVRDEVLTEQTGTKRLPP